MKEIKKGTKYEFLNQHEFVYNDIWYINGVPAYQWFVDNIVNRFYGEDVADEYGVGSSLSKIQGSENFWLEDIIRHWIDEYIRNLAYAHYRKVFANTVGNEKEKEKMASFERDQIFKLVAK